MISVLAVYPDQVTYPANTVLIPPLCHFADHLGDEPVITKDDDRLVVLGASECGGDLPSLQGLGFAVSYPLWGGDVIQVFYGCCHSNASVKFKKAA